MSINMMNTKDIIEYALILEISINLMNMMNIKDINEYEY